MTEDKKTKISIVLIAILLIAFAGCTAPGEQVVKTPGGDVKISGTTGTGSDWCKVGTSITTTGPDGKLSSYTVKGITTYEGKEVCESDSSSSEGSYKTYVGKDGTFLVMVITDKDGKETKIDMSQPKK